MAETKVSVLDLQRRHWPILSYLPHSVLKNARLVYVLGFSGTNVLLATNVDTLHFLGSSRNLIPWTCSDVSPIGEVKELSQKRIKGFACNSRLCVDSSKLFVIVYLASGYVYLWGYDPSVNNINTVPFLIQKLPNTVEKVACGENHCLALTSDGKVYAWGDNAYGQTSIALTIPSVSKPVRVLQKLQTEDVADIACGSNFSVVVTRKHRVYGWGRNNSRCLGRGTDKKYMPLVRKISVFKNIDIQQIACGGGHILALDNYGYLFSSGNNSFGQLGYNEDGDRVSLRFKEIAATINASAGVTLGGEVMVWGNITDEIIDSPLKTPCCSINEAFALYNLGGMYRQIEVAPGNDTIAETMRKSFGNLETSDFKIVVEGKEIFVHKSILAVRSKYFERMFEKNWLEGKKSFIQMNETYEGMSAFLKYLYTDEINIVDPKVLLDVAMIADKYCEMYLVNLCKQKFESNLDDSNVGELYQLTLDLKLSNFSELCIDYASRYLKAVIASKGYNSWRAETFKAFFQHDKIKSALSD